MTPPSAAAEARDAITRAEGFRRVWRTVRFAMLAVLVVFLALLLTYTGLAVWADKGAWHIVFLLVGDSFLGALIALVVRHRGIDLMLDADVAAATDRLAAADDTGTRDTGTV